ncbi:MAG: calcium-translocating P-type ATPase, SERCA-type [Methanocellales archaeon]
MDWYSKSIEELFVLFNTSKQGITQEQAKQALLKYGFNKLKEKPKPHPIIKFIGQFKSVPILMLIAATFILVLLTIFTPENRLTDAIVILIVIFLNAIMGYIQEARAEKAMEALKRLTSPKAKVLRDGVEKVIDVKEVVPGDILLLEEGDRIPADGRILESHNLEVDESMLTGESTTVRKEAVSLAGKVPIADQVNMVFMGTIITRGRGKAIAVATGMDTEIGRIARFIQEEEEEETPLQRRLNSMGKQIGAIALVAMVVLFSIDMLIPPSNLIEGFLLAVSLAVAIIPEGLPIVTLVTLAVGMQIMAKKNAVIRRLMCVETLGCTTVICSDKTGTLTKNEMTLREMHIAGKRYRVTGEGYSPEGEILSDGEKADLNDPSLKRAFEIMALCNNAHLIKEGGKWHAVGDPTEAALVAAVGKAKLNPKELREKLPRIEEKIFDPKRKYMTTIHAIDSEGKIAFIKGAPEVLLELSKYILENGRTREITESDRKAIENINLEFASKAYRVLAIGYKQLGQSEMSEIEKDMTLVGILGIADPPRSEAKRAIDQCREAGIKVVMITGDQKSTAIAVARELGLITGDGKDKVLTGWELDQMDDEEFKKIAGEVRVYARVSPEHKMKIVNALKSRGEIVAMTGDGVNDAPALTKSDIGISMGISGTDVAKEASDMVLMDDNFASIVAAVEEGRRIYDNIRKFIRYQLSTNVGAILLLFLATILVPYAIPMYPVQLLWINIMMDGPPAIALGLEPADKEIMKRPPRDPEEKILSSAILKAIFLNGCIMGLGAFLLFYWAYYFSGHSDAARYAQTTTFTGYVIYQMFNVFNCRSLERSIFSIGLTSNKFLLLAVSTSIFLQVLVVYVPLFNILFHTVPLKLEDWVVILIAASSVLILEEIKKAIIH